VYTVQDKKDALIEYWCLFSKNILILWPKDNWHYRYNAKNHWTKSFVETWDEDNAAEWLHHWRICACLCVSGHGCPALPQRVLRERETGQIFIKYCSYQHCASKKTPSCLLYMIMPGLLLRLEQVMLHGFKTFQAVCLRTFSSCNSIM